MKKLIAVLTILLPVLAAAQSVADIQQQLRYRKYVSAAEMARRLVSQHPGNTQHLYWLSQVLLQSNNTTALHQIARAHPGEPGNDPWLNIVKGNILLASGNTTDARVYFNRAVAETRSRNKDVLAAVARVNIYSKSGDKAFALELLKKAIRRDKKDPELYTLQGDAHFRLKDGSSAYKAFEHALKVYSSYAPAMYELGKIFATQQNEELYLRYYKNTVAADPSFAPALYDLYYHYYKKDINMAWDYFNRYMAVADRTPADEYQHTDLLYLTGRYPEAIIKANTLLQQPDAENRLNKLVAYTYKEMDKPDSSVIYMNRYLSGETDSNFLVKDYEFLVGIYNGMKGYEDAVAALYKRILPLLSDENERRNYYEKLAAHFKAQEDYKSQSHWLGMFYAGNNNATNLDLFNWGLSLFQAMDYRMSDSVFSIYEEKYPEHVYGYYWQARSNAAIDSAMDLGLAIPHYEKMIEVAMKDTSNAVNRQYLVEAFGYLATYAANEQKDYHAAIGYFENLLQIDPANEDARRYIDILEKITKRQQEKTTGDQTTPATTTDSK